MRNLSHHSRAPHDQTGGQLIRQWANVFMPANKRPQRLHHFKGQCTQDDGKSVFKKRFLSGLRVGFRTISDACLQLRHMGQRKFILRHYVQDDCVPRHVTLNIGLRWEYTRTQKPKTPPPPMVEWKTGSRFRLFSGQRNK